MAIRCDAAGDGLTRTTNLPSISAWTMMGWFYFVSAPGAATWNTPFMIGINAGGGAWFGLQIEGASPVFDIWANGGDAVGSTVLSLNTWYHLALTFDGNDLIAYLNGVQEAVFTTGGTGTVTSQVMKFGHDVETPDEHIDGRMMAIKVWGATLTAAEVLQEMQTILPKRLANLNTFSPCFPGSGERARDLSGVGGNWTEDGTLTDEAPAPISWGASRRRIKFKPSSGTLYFQSCSGGITPSGTLSKQTNRPLTGGITPAGALVKQTIRATAGAITPAGVLLKQLTRALTGGVTPTGALVSQKQKALSGSISPTGAISKSTQRPLSGSMTPSGTVARSTQRSLSGGVTPSGTLSRLTSRLLSGGITLSGSLLSGLIHTISLVGAILPTGVVNAVYQAGGGVVAFVQQFWPRRRRRRR